MSATPSQLVRLLEKDSAYDIHINFYIVNKPLYVSIQISRQDGYPTHSVTCRDLEGREGCYKLGEAIGNNSSICEIQLYGNTNANDVLSNTSYECLEAFYRGLQLTTLIHTLTVNVNLFPDSGELPPMNNSKRVLQEMTLEELEMEDGHFDQYGYGFGRIISSCLKVRVVA
eukprot:scaffold145938_cov76-Cyclotella_meneghiniana.AAC.1